MFDVSNNTDFNRRSVLGSFVCAVQPLAFLLLTDRFVGVPGSHRNIGQGAASSVRVRILAGPIGIRWGFQALGGLEFEGWLEQSIMFASRVYRGQSTFNLKTNLEM